MSYTHFKGVSVTEDGFAVGEKGSEVQAVGVDGTLYQQGVAITASAAEINAISGGGLDSTELGILNGATVTTAELNTLDRSANIQTIVAAGAITLASDTVKLDSTAGPMAVTLAAPTAAEVGRTKIIEMTVDGGDVTLSLANVQGGSAGTTCTWANVGECLVLIAGVSKWNVASEGGVVLT